MTMTDNEVSTSTLFGVRLGTDYPEYEWPLGMRDRRLDLSDDERTFFALQDDEGFPFLVVPLDDPRHAGMRVASGQEQRLMTEAGLENPATGYQVWSILREGWDRLEEPVALPVKEGDRVVIEGYSVPFEGLTGTVTEVHPGGGAVNVRFDENDRTELAVGGFDAKYVKHYVEVPDDAASLEDPRIAELQDALHQMEVERDQAQALAAARLSEHEADIDRISDDMIEVATRKGYCSDYDQVVDSVNERLTIPLRRRVVTYDVSLRVYYDISIIVEADSEAAAEAIVSNGDKDSDIRYAVRNAQPDDVEIREVEESN